MVDEKLVIEFLTRHDAMGKPEDSPWPSFDPDTQERVALDLHRFMTDDAYLIAVSQVGQQAVFDAMVEALWASLPLEHGPVYSEFYCELIGRIGFAEAKAAFNARYPHLADKPEEM